MRIWADVFNGAGTKLNPSPIRLISASITKELDGAGKFRIEAPARSKVALDWLLEEFTIRIYTYSDSGIREIAAGVIRERRISQSGSSWRIVVTGPDILEELRRYITFVAWIYDNQHMDEIVTDLVSDLGWTATVAQADNTISARFDGTRRLQAIYKIAASQGYHFRAGLGTKEIEVGPFGEDSGFTLINPGRMHRELYDEANVLLIDSIQQITSTEGLVNFMVPYGAGEGEAALTLSRSTRNWPYPILNLESKGKTIYYIKNQASIDNYDTHQALVTFKDVAPISNGSVALVDAANFLYDNAAANLMRMSEKKFTYSITVRKVRVNIRPGQKVRIMYKGFVVDEDGNRVNYLNINQLFWVMAVSENYGNTQGASLVICNVDQLAKDALDYIVESIEEVNLRNVKPQIYPFYFEKTTYDFIQAAFVPANKKNAEFEIRLRDNVTAVNRVTISFRTRVLYTTATVTGSLTWTPIYQANILNSTFYPQGIRLLINGDDVSDVYGGPWNVGFSAALEVEDIDITRYLEATGDIHTPLSIVFSCDPADGDLAYPGYTSTPATALKSNGTVELTVDVIGSTQNIISAQV